MAGKAKNLDMTKGSPVRLMLQFALPMLIGSVFQSLYTMVDSAVLGRYVGSNALAAIGATSSTINFMLLLATGVTSAVSIVMSQSYGAGDKEGVRKSLVSAIYMTIILGLGLGAIGIAAAKPLMTLLKTPKEIINMSTQYIMIICGCGIAQFAYNAVSSVLRALGDSRTPLIFLIVCSLLNVVLDLVSVLVLNMGVAGVAIATVLSQAVSAVICIIFMFKRFPDLRLKRDDFKFDMRITKRIFTMGAQMALQSAFLSVGMMVITRVINGFGSNVVAAFTVGSSVEGLAMILFSNFAFGFSVYVGQNYGARSAERIRLGFKQIFLLVGGLTVVACALSQLLAVPLVNLYVKTEETAVVNASLSFVRIQACFFPFLGWIWLYNSTLKGMGKIGITMVSSFVELGSKIGFSILLPIWFGYTGIWFAAPIGWILGMLPDVIYYHRGKWIAEMES